MRNVQQEMAKEMRYQNMATKAIESMPPSEMLFSDHDFQKSQPLRDSVNTFHLWAGGERDIRLGDTFLLYGRDAKAQIFPTEYEEIKPCCVQRVHVKLL